MAEFYKKNSERKKDRVVQLQHDWYVRNKDRIAVTGKTRYWKDPQLSRQKNKENYDKHREKRLARSKRQDIKDRGNAIRRHRSRHDANYIANNICRTMVGRAIKGDLSTIDYIGCTFEEFRIHLESKFYPHPITNELMSWDKYGQKDGKTIFFEIDHIVPVSALDVTSEDAKKAVTHYTNLRPLWWEENRRKRRKCFCLFCRTEMFQRARGPMPRSRKNIRELPAEISFQDLLTGGLFSSCLEKESREE
jgi:hypothetical protein